MVVNCVTATLDCSCIQPSRDFKVCVFEVVSFLFYSYCNLPAKNLRYRIGIVNLGYFDLCLDSWSSGEQ